ncbi:hypothetical protein [Sphingomonas morindae]|uniref:Uncharacterized protein n=1 Tax=Sphingomonas morindae TaxID=1541170 RepID=A0ABY4X9Q1_9SPHN|nr:hypothetical protein [Sphingomonas morindae]USI73549.1 hypothetical protein LHA26_03445 [Sphingomonas morindae]
MLGDLRLSEFELLHLASQEHGEVSPPPFEQQRTQSGEIAQERRLRDGLFVSDRAGAFADGSASAASSGPAEERSLSPGRSMA